MTDGDAWDSIERLRDRLTDNPDISTADAADLREFSERLELLNSDYTDARHEKLLGHLVRLAERCGGLSDTLEDRDAAEDVVRHVNRSFDNEEYNRDHRLALRAFGKHATEDGDPIPDSLEWVSSTYSNNYDPAPQPENMLRWEQEVKPMIDAAHNARDKAYIALAWDLGARPSEMHALQVGNVSDHKYGLKVTIEDGKTGTRSPLIVPAVPYVNRWLSEHPGRDDPEAPLWSKLRGVEGVSDRMERKLLEEAAERAGVTRPVTRRNFRKSSASYLASQNLNQTYIEDHHGWVRGSKVAARYVAVFGEESDSEIAKVHGVEVQQDETETGLAPVQCTRCGRDTPSDEPTCQWCGQVVDHAGAEQIQREQQSVRTELLSIVRSNPDLLERVDELEQFLELADRDPEVVLDIVEGMSGVESDG